MSEKMLRWSQGREEVQALIDQAKLQRVIASRDHAELLISQSLKHLTSAEHLAVGDLEGAYSLLYDATRKAFVAVLEVQGLRPTSRGGHVVIYEVLRAQIDPPLGEIVTSFNRLRRSRHNSEYPSPTGPALSSEDVLEDLVKAREIVNVAIQILDQFPVF